FVDIADATAATYQPAALTATTVYQAVVTDNCGVVTTNTVTVTVYDEFVATAAADQTICYNTVPAALTVTAAGGAGNYSYQWQVEEGGVFVDIADATAATYQPAALTATTVYQAVVTDNCGVITTNTVTITVYDEFVATAAADQTICYNTVPAALAVTATGGAGNYSYQWQVEEGGVFVDIANASAATYQPVALTATTAYQAVVTDNCGVVTTNTVTITVYDEFAASAAADQTICYNTVPAALAVTATGGAGNYSYQWQVEEGGVFVDIANASEATYQPAALTATTVYQAVVTDNCGVITTNTVTVTVYEELAATAAADQTVCYGFMPEPIVATATGGAGNYTYQWQVEEGGVFVDIANASEATYNPEVIYAATNYQCVVMDDCGTVVSNIVSITMYEDVVVVIEADQLICHMTAPEPLTSTVTGGVGNYAYQWQVEESGVFVDIANASEATYQPEALTGETHYRLVVTDDCGTFTSNTVVITIIPLPVANAGEDQNVCASSLVQLEGTAENAGSVLWTTSGDGTFADATILDAVYTPGAADIAAGTVDLTLTAYAVEPCTDSASDMVTIEFAEDVTVNAGDDDTVCEGSSYQTMGSTIMANSILWTTAGDGTFDDPTVTYAIYTPGPADQANGSVVLTLGAEPIAPCTDWKYDDVTLTILSNPSVNAGPDATICSAETHVLSATATDYATALWTTSGDGSFDNSASLTAEYTPGADDIANGGAILTLTVTAIAPCTETATDDVALTIVSSPNVFAGEDAHTCEGLPYTIADATVADGSTVLWTTNGSGTFDDPTLINPTYTPSAGDLGMGTVILTVTASNGSPCNEEETDSMDLTVHHAPVVNSGGDQDICENDAVELDAVASDYVAVEWTTTGDGEFVDPTSLHTFYALGENDIANGSVVLTITATGESVCGSVSDEMLVTVAARTYVFAGEDTKVCEGNDLELSGAEASNYVSVLWTTSGDGVFDDPTAVNPTYVPGTFDITYGSVDLTISAEAHPACGGYVDDVIVVSIDKAPETPEAPMGDEHTCIYDAKSVYNVDDVVGADAYEWEISPAEAGSFNDGDTEVELTWSEGWQGDFVIRVRATNDCGESEWSESLTGYRDDCVGISEEDLTVSIFPNPTDGLFTVSVNGLTSRVELSIVNYDGRQLQKEILENVNTYEHSFNLTRYPAGVYFLRIQGDNFLRVERIVIR
ncbi:MAG: hypothetical protein CSA95_04900, partial [Bacteroidetes bacterium]